MWLQDSIKLAPLEVSPKTGSATASTDTKVTFSYLTDILGAVYEIKKVWLSRIIAVITGAIDVVTIVQGKVSAAYKALSPNFTVVVPYDPPKRIAQDLVLILTESAGTAQNYNIQLVMMQEMKV